MLKVYVKSSCSSSRKMKSWFKEHQVAFKEINVNTSKISEKEIKEMLEFTQRGTGDLISQRGKTYTNLSKKINFEELKFNDYIKIILSYPALLKSPIVFDGKTLLVGYDIEEMRIFLPKLYRKVKYRKFD